MGPVGFYKWIREEHGYVGAQVYVSARHRLLVDAKALMYRFAYGIPIDSLNYHQDVVNVLVARFGHFAHVTFINDGQVNKEHPKYETDCKRGVQRAKQRDAVETSAKRIKLSEEAFLVCPLNAEEEGKLDKEVEKLDRAARAARGISYSDSLKIMNLLEALPNFSCIQCEKGEADHLLIRMAASYDFVISEDGDLLCGGITNLLRGFATPDQLLYNAADILATLNLTLTQLQEIVCISGNDYRRTKIPKMGLKKAYDFIHKHGSCESMIQKWNKKERKTFKLPPNFQQELTKACLLYNPKATFIVAEQQEIE